MSQPAKFNHTFYFSSLRIDPGVRGVVYCTAIRAGEEKEWEFLFNEYKRAAVVTEKMRLMSALSCARQPWLLYR